MKQPEDISPFDIRDFCCLIWKIFIFLWYNTHFCPSPLQFIFSEVYHSYECFVQKLRFALRIQERTWVSLLLWRTEIAPVELENEINPLGISNHLAGFWQGMNGVWTKLIWFSRGQETPAKLASALHIWQKRLLYKSQISLTTFFLLILQ